MRKLTANERKDRLALQAVNDPGICTRGMITRVAGAATLARLEARGFVTRDENSLYSDALTVTFDGKDYLAVLEEDRHD